MDFGPGTKLQILADHNCLIITTNLYIFKPVLCKPIEGPWCGVVFYSDCYVKTLCLNQSLAIISVAAFIALLDNYERDTGCAETVTQEEIAENRRFIDLVMETEPMKIAHSILAQNRKVPADVRRFKHQLYQIWFELYSRTKGNRWVIYTFISGQLNALTLSRDRMSLLNCLALARTKWTLLALSWGLLGFRNRQSSLLRKVSSVKINLLMATLLPFRVPYFLILRLPYSYWLKS